MIIVCARCQRQVDSGAAGLGEVIHCPCGQAILVPAGPTEAGKISCPSCGAPVDPASGRCSFCDTRLATGLCPNCFGATFEGVKYCSHCGEALTGRMIIQGGQTKHTCPRCKDESLRVEVVSGSPLERCTQCEGMWVDRETVEKIYKDGGQNSAIKSITTSQRKVATQDNPLDGSKRSKNQINTQGYIRCPMCDTVMNRQNFGRHSGVVVDICREHGTWFDADELHRILAFISDGGLQKAALKEKQALEEEVRRLESKRFLNHGDAIWVENIEFQDDKNVIGGSMVAIAWNLLKRLF